MGLDDLWKIGASPVTTLEKSPVEGLGYEVVGNQSGGDPERLVGFCRRIFTTRFRDNSRRILATSGL